MKKQVLTTAVMASLLVMLVVITAYAGVSAKAVATIPFAFTAGRLTAPAGTYTLAETVIAGVLQLRNAQGSTSFISTKCGADVEKPAKVQLIFHRYGERYFLAQISYGVMGGYLLPMSAAEREARDGKSNSLAKNELQPELVYIDAH
jgi:uncharacterized membrane protein